jgi:chaperone LolA
MLNSNIAYAQPNDASQQLVQVLQSIHAIQGTFRQTIATSRGKILQSSIGTMAIQKPNKFVWNLQSPTQQLIVSDGRNLWVYNKNLKQVSVQSLKRNLSSTPALLLSASPQTITHYFSVAYDNGWYYLTAKSSSSIFQQVRIQFSGNRLKQMSLVDNLGHVSTLQFGELRVNPPLRANLFHFIPPAGVDVVGKAQ